mmetsp:Transcript_27454/g.72125  ORF Transcript_27454/g.72125 Transcript_27454/m.72125 type:complete len:642 (+) Transcript_27454:161-2086(+)
MRVGALAVASVAALSLGQVARAQQVLCNERLSHITWGVTTHNPNHRLTQYFRGSYSLSGATLYAVRNGANVRIDSYGSASSSLREDTGFWDYWLTRWDRVEYVLFETRFASGCIGQMMYCPGPAGCTTLAPSSRSPTRSPTRAPTAAPTRSPTRLPTRAPSTTPTRSPTGSPTRRPTLGPTVPPSASPTALPTAAPSASPTTLPTAAPSAGPTTEPTIAPTAVPTATPTATPTHHPSAAPTAAPAVAASAAGAGAGGGGGLGGGVAMYAIVAVVAIVLLAIMLFVGARRRRVAKASAAVSGSPPETADQVIFNEMFSPGTVGHSRSSAGATTSVDVPNAKQASPLTKTEGLGMLEAAAQCPGGRGVGNHGRGRGGGGRGRGPAGRARPSAAPPRETANSRPVCAPEYATTYDTPTMAYEVPQLSKRAADAGEYEAAYEALAVHAVYQPTPHGTLGNDAHLGPDNSYEVPSKEAEAEYLAARRRKAANAPKPRGGDGGKADKKKNGEKSKKGKRGKKASVKLETPPPAAGSTFPKGSGGARINGAAPPNAPRYAAAPPPSIQHSGGKRKNGVKKAAAAPLPEYTAPADNAYATFNMKLGGDYEDADDPSASTYSSQDAMHVSAVTKRQESAEEDYALPVVNV